MLIAAAVFFSRPAATETVSPETGGCPIGSGSCQASGAHEGAASATPGEYDFTLDKLGGGTITLAEYRGHTPVIVDFWASWCPNCRRDMPKLNRWYTQYRDQVEVIGVNLQEDSKTVEQFIQRNGIVFPIALDPSGAASAHFGIQFTNSHFLFNKAGELTRVIPGDIKESDIVSLIES